MNAAGTVAAVDLGASSGRVMLGRVGGSGELSVHPVARFANDPVRTIDGLHWNILGLYGHVIGGLRAAVAKEPALASIGIDSWAVDYALLRGDRMLGNPFHYRDELTGAGVLATDDLVTPEELYARNGLQLLPFNTLFQLAADRLAGALDGAGSMLRVPNLLTFWLTGRRVAEPTNASTTGLLDVRTGGWDQDLLGRLDLPRGLLPPLVDAGTRIGDLLPAVAADLGAAAALEVVAVGSHDSASAIVAVPMTSPDAAYISCGTWSLVGIELESPVLTVASRDANCTSEGGVDGRERFLRNVMGLWLLSESIRTRERAGTPCDLPDLLAAAAQLPSGRRPPFPGARRLAVPDHRPVPRARAAGAAHASRVRAQHRGEPRGRVRAHRAVGRRAVGNDDPHRASRGWWFAEPPALPTHCGPRRPDRAGRTGRGDRHR